MKFSKKKFAAMILSAGLILGTVSGCGNKVRVAEDIKILQIEMQNSGAAAAAGDGNDSVGESDGDETEVGQNSGESGSGAGGKATGAGSGLNIPTETVKETVSGDNGVCKLNVEFNVTDPELTDLSLPTYQMEAIPIDDAYLQSLIESLFEEGTWKVLKPPAFSTKEELSDADNYFKSELMEEENAFRNGEKLFFGTLADDYVNEINKGLISGVNHIEDMDPLSGEDPIIYSYTERDFHYSEAAVVGRIEDAYYLFHYLKEGFYSDIWIERVYTATDWNEEDRYREGTERLERLGEGNNASERSAGEKIANGILSKLGRDHLMLVDEYQNLLRTIDGPFEANGYQFEYAPGNELLTAGIYANGIIVQVPDNPAEISQFYGARSNAGEKLGYKQDSVGCTERVTVDIGDGELYGIRLFGAYKDFKIEETSEGKLLSFDKIKEQGLYFAKCLCDYQEKNKTWQPYFYGGQVELKYTIVQKDGHARMVPAWIFFEDNDDCDDNYVWAAINAYDGTIMEYVY